MCNGGAKLVFHYLPWKYYMSILVMITLNYYCKHTLNWHSPVCSITVSITSKMLAWKFTLELICFSAIWQLWVLIAIVVFWFDWSFMMLIWLLEAEIKWCTQMLIDFRVLAVSVYFILWKVIRPWGNCLIKWNMIGSSAFINLCNQSLRARSVWMPLGNMLS